MDFLSLAFSPVPLYFVGGPLLILMIGLVVLAAVKASPTQQVMVQQAAPAAPSIDVSPQPNTVFPATITPTTSPAPMISSIPEPVVPYTSPVSETPHMVDNVSPVTAETSAQIKVPAPVVQEKNINERPATEIIHDPQVTIQPVPVITQVNSTPIPEPVVITMPEHTTEPVNVPPFTIVIPQDQAPQITQTASTKTQIAEAEVLPPVSSWKPVEAVIVPVDVTHTEAQMQAEAVKSSV